MGCTLGPGFSYDRYVYDHVGSCRAVCVYIYICREREGQRERERERERVLQGSVGFEGWDILENQMGRGLHGK